MAGNFHKHAKKPKMLCKLGHSIVGSHNTTILKRFFTLRNQNLIAGSKILKQGASTDMQKKTKCYVN